MATTDVSLGSKALPKQPSGSGSTEASLGSKTLDGMRSYKIKEGPTSGKGSGPVADNTNG